MRVPRFFAVGLPAEPDAPYTLDGDEAVHLTRVLRLEAGAEVELFDGRGGCGRFRIEEVGRRSSTLRLLERVEVSRELPFRLTLAVAPPKKKRRQRLIEALTELGVETVHPLRCARGQNPQLDPERVRRWSLEAAKQCGRNRLLAAGAALDVAGLSALAAEHDLALLPDPGAGNPSLRTALPAHPPARILAAVGPEGGFSDAERAQLIAAGFEAARLGPSILRIETAACALAAALIASWA